MYAELLERLKPHGQEHLLAFWNRLDAQGQARLAAEIEQLDLGVLSRLGGDLAGEEDVHALAGRAEAPPAIRLDAVGPISGEEARRLGVAALSAGRVGALLVAGGQGSRLGFEHPKGMFPIGPVSRASLFQILLEKIGATRRRYGAAVPLYIMTSPATHEETLAYLAEHDYFSLPVDDVHVFCQGTLPAVDAESGRVLLSGPDRLAISPDGHGGMLAALKRSGGLADAARRGLEQLFYFQVDNPLATVCDPELIGHHLLARSEYTLQVAAKQAAQERVGNVVSVDGRLRIIEYSDLPDEVAAARNPDGSLKLWAGSIAVHVFEARFLRRLAESRTALPLHQARKKVAYVDGRGALHQPAEPNAVKFERFIFDLLPHAARALAVEVDPAAAFAPVKNANGEASDTPELVERQMVALASRWLAAAGANVAAGVKVEISPTFALDEADLRAKIAPGTTIARDTYLR